MIYKNKTLKLTKEQVSVINMYFSDDWRNLTIQQQEKNMEVLTGKPFSMYYEDNGKDYFNVDLDIVFFKFLEQYPFNKHKSKILDKLYDSNSLQLTWFIPQENEETYEDLLNRNFRKQ